MVNYKNGKVYKIVCNESGLCYVGSTCEKYLSTRLSKHKSDYKKYLHDDTNHYYVTSYEVLKLNNFDIILIEKYPCESKEELYARERFYIETTECVNKYVPCRTSQEYYKDNKEKLLENVKNYRLKNIEKIREYDRKRVALRKEYKKDYDKNYREQNQDKIKEYSKSYRQTHKNIRNTEIINCECGLTYQKCSKARHLKSKTHQQFFENN